MMTYELFAWYEPFLLSFMMIMKLFEGQIDEM